MKPNHDMAMETAAREVAEFRREIAAMKPDGIVYSVDFWQSIN